MIYSKHLVSLLIFFSFCVQTVLSAKPPTCTAGACLSASSCVSCGTGSYSDGTVQACPNASPMYCTTCPANADCTGAGLTIFSCLPGYTISGTAACVACAQGTWKSTTDNVACTTCAVGTNTAGTGSTSAGACVGPPTTSNVSTTSKLATTSSALITSSLAVTSSVTTTFVLQSTTSLSNSNSATATTAPSVSSGLPLSTSTSSAPPVVSSSSSSGVVSSSSPSSSSEPSPTYSSGGTPISTPYSCPIGQTPSGSFCVSCPTQYVKQLTGNGTCTKCADTTVSFNNICSCAVGYEMLSAEKCTACSVGNFKSVISRGVCQSCPSDADCLSTALANPVCHSGFTLGSGNATCTSSAAQDTGIASYLSGSNLLYIAGGTALFMIVIISLLFFCCCRKQSGATKEFNGMQMDEGPQTYNANNVSYSGQNTQAMAFTGVYSPTQETSVMSPTTTYSSEPFDPNRLPKEGIINTAAIDVGQVSVQESSFLLFEAQLITVALAKEVRDRSIGFGKFFLKVVNDDDPSSVLQQTANLMMEARILYRIHTSSVSAIVGYCENPFALIIGAFDCTLQAALQSNPDWLVTEQEQMFVAGEIASGLSALHRVGVVHTDMMLSNVGINFSTNGGFPRVRIINLHKALVLSENNATLPLLNFGFIANYAAPETFGDRTVREIVPFAADVYAYGITVLAMIMRADPYAGFSLEEIVQVVNSADRLAWFTDGQTNLTQIAMDACAVNISDRPSSEDLTMRFTSSINTSVTGMTQQSLGQTRGSNGFPALAPMHQLSKNSFGQGQSRTGTQQRVFGNNGVQQSMQSMGQSSSRTGTQPQMMSYAQPVVNRSQAQLVNQSQFLQQQGHMPQSAHQSMANMTQPQAFYQPPMPAPPVNFATYVDNADEVPAAYQQPNQDQYSVPMNSGVPPTQDSIDEDANKVPAQMAELDELAAAMSGFE